MSNWKSPVNPTEAITGPHWWVIGLDVSAETLALPALIDSGLVGRRVFFIRLWWGPTRRENALFWDRPRVVCHRVYFSIRRKAGNAMNVFWLHLCTRFPDLNILHGEPRLVRHSMHLQRWAGCVAAGRNSKTRPTSSSSSSLLSLQVLEGPWALSWVIRESMGRTLTTSRRVESDLGADIRGIFISHRVFLKLFCKSQFPHKSVNLFFILVIIKDKLTDLCRIWFLQNAFKNTLSETRRLGAQARRRGRRCSSRRARIKFF